MPPFIRSPYNYDATAVSEQTGLKCEDPSLTVQADAIDADINTIVKRFGLTGMLPQNVRVPLASDFTEALDYKDALNAIRAAEESFMEMPASVRETFNHDPAKFVDFCLAEKDGKLLNIDKMRELGLAVPAPTPPPTPTPTPTPPTNPPA